MNYENAELPFHNARATDPDTSHAAARSLNPHSHKQILLNVFHREPGGLTAEEAGYLAGMLTTGYWKRVSDLKRDGLIVDSGKRRPAMSGRDQIVWVPA